MAVLDRVPVDAINTRAHAIADRVRQVKIEGIMALLALPLVIFGYALKLLVFGVVRAVIWVVAAFLTGWDMGPSLKVKPDEGG